MDNLRTVYSVDYDPVDKMIYWTDIAKYNYGMIKRAYLDGTGMLLYFHCDWSAAPLTQFLSCFEDKK